MTELTQLFVVLAAVYFLECLQVVPRGAGCVQTLFRRFRAGTTTPLGMKRGAGLLLGMPLPPLGVMFVVERWPVLLGKDELVAEDGTAHPWASLRDAASDQTRVVVGEVTLAALASEPAATAMAAALRRLARATPEKRERQLDEILAARLDAETARRRVAGFVRAAWPLLGAENLLFVSAFVGAPLVFHTELVMWWPIPAGGALVGWIGSIVGFALVRRRCFGKDGAPAGPPLARLIALALWPIGAMRGSDVLGRSLLADVDPLAAATLLPPGGFRDAARRLLAEHRYPVSPPDATRRFHEARLDRAVAKLLRAEDVVADDLFVPPAPDDPTVVSFCPRCRTQYVRAVDACAACPTVRVLPMPRAVTPAV